MKEPSHDREEFELASRQVGRSFGRAARSYDAAAVLQAQVRTELLSRLDMVRLTPALIVDLGSGTGVGAMSLRRRYRSSRVVALDLSIDMQREAGRRQRWRRRYERVCADAASLPLIDGAADLVFSNLMLQWCNDPDAVFRECARVLRPGGLMTYTSFGPDTLKELRSAWAVADGHTHVNRFIDMHDLGDAMLRAGLAEPVMDVERYTLTYPDVRTLMRDLKAIGAHNVNAGRPRGLTGRQAIARMTEAYEERRSAGRLPATYEVVYGQAWSPTTPRRQRAGDGEVRIPIDRIGHRN